MSRSKILKMSEIVSSEDVFHIPDAAGVSQNHGEPVAEAATDCSGETPQDAPASDDVPEEPQIVTTRQEDIEQLSKKILASARAEHDKILRSANEDAVRIRKQARQEAYDEAFSQKREELVNLLTRVDHCLEELTTRQQSFFESYRRDLRGLALAVAEKIMNHSIETDPQTISDLVMQAVASVKSEEWVTVEVSEQLPDLVALLKAEYAKYPGKRTVDFVAEELPPGGCLVQTPSGIIDASIGTQLDNLRTIFTELGR